MCLYLFGMVLLVVKSLVYLLIGLVFVLCLSFCFLVMPPDVIAFLKMKKMTHGRLNDMKLSIVGMEFEMCLTVTWTWTVTLDNDCLGNLK